MQEPFQPAQCPTRQVPPCTLKTGVCRCVGFQFWFAWELSWGVRRRPRRKLRHQRHPCPRPSKHRRLRQRLQHPRPCFPPILPVGSPPNPSRHSPIPPLPTLAILKLSKSTTSPTAPPPATSAAAKSSTSAHSVFTTPAAPMAPTPSTASRVGPRRTSAQALHPTAIAYFSGSATQ